MKKHVYVDTSIISYLTARPSRNILAAAWQQVTEEWWDTQRRRFDLFTSEVVLAEAGQGDPDAAQRRIERLRDVPGLAVTKSVAALARKLLEEGALPREATDDAMHVAIAAVHGVDYLLTLNCCHLDNAEHREKT
ncbi:MAG: type II toxin-antitoxin system VapC family toxin [Coprothermobacterota bacterium]|nr:type II toxin-antitoxin system VapC family toxin [Coprothermobacterota bacterium]